MIWKDVCNYTKDKALCFGHFQKMFNMALKFYLCLYISKEYLELDESFFDKRIIENMKNADCPMDSIILKRLDKKQRSDGKKYSDIKWSKMDVKDGSYMEVQNAIDNIDKKKYKSRLSFDFKEWN